MVTKSFLFHFIQPENGWGSLVYILGLVIAIPIYLQSSESSLDQLWLATVCWEIQFHNWLVLVVNYQLRSMFFPSPFVFNTDTNAFTMLLPNPWRFIKVFLQGRTWWVFETLATLKTRAFFQANAHFLQALFFMTFCEPLDNSDPCRGENLALSLVHVDHYIERAKEEDNCWRLTDGACSSHLWVRYLVKRVLFSIWYDLMLLSPDWLENWREIFKLCNH